MERLFQKVAGWSAIFVGLASIKYAVFFLYVTPRSEYLGALASWLILAFSGLFATKVYVALYQHLKKVSELYALWTVLIGFSASMATAVHGLYQALLMREVAFSEGTRGIALRAVELAPSQVDPKGAATFALSAIAVFFISWVFTRSRTFPRALATVGMVNGAVLLALFFATIFDAGNIILLTGGLSSIILTPVWWIGVGRTLLKEA